VELRDAVVWLLVISGVVLVGYGVSIGDEAIYSIDAKVVENETEMRETVQEREVMEVIEYDRLSPARQDLFREAIAIDESISVPESETFGPVYVHYRDSYYLVRLAVGDASMERMFWWIVRGLALGIGGPFIWYVYRYV